ncbi:hypothetical protein SMJ63A_10085 [Stenotrophomonas geniculata]
MHSNAWGDAQRASRPAPDKEKGLPFGSPFSLSGGEGGSLSHTPPETLATLDLAPEAPAQGVQGSVHDTSPPYHGKARPDRRPGRTKPSASR